MAPAALLQISPEVRARLATRLTRQQQQLIASWEARHRKEPLLAEPVIAALGDWETYRRGYLEPLVRTLTEGIRSGSPDPLRIYVHERKRYLDSASLRDGSRGVFLQTLQGDARDAVALIDEASGDRLALSELLDALHLSIAGETDGRFIKLMVVGDCLFTDVVAFLEPKVRSLGLGLSVEHLYFSAWAGTSLSREELLETVGGEEFDLIGMSFLTFEGIPPYLALLAESDRLSHSERGRRVDQIDALIRKYVSDLREATDVPILLHGACGLPLTRLRQAVSGIPAMSRGRRRTVAMLNVRLRELAENSENVVFVDEETLVANAGLRAAGSRILPRSVTGYRKSVFHPTGLGAVLSEPYADAIEAYRDLAKCKVLLVDFDNTLWKGVMAEGPVEHDLEGQRLLRRLKDAGILLVSVSKNDPDAIRWEEMALDHNDFVLHKVNWNLKSQSVQEAAHQLDLGLNTFVLLDDNPVEREMVTSQVPEVIAIDPLQPATWRHLERMLEFPNTRETAESARRTQMYREAAARRDAVSGGADYPAMMRTLKLKVGFGRARARDLDRLHELVDRTNQFNTTTTRYTRAELSELLKGLTHEVFVGTLSDRFGSLGIVGCSIVRSEADTLTFESVIMSCRAMGFGFETVLLRASMDAVPEAQHVLGRFVPTDRNRPCASLFRDAGFSIDGETQWRLDASHARPEIPDWLEVGEL
jgi:FkbH-like protein